jgi:HAD superfamily hydrolase (TIGR01509 family)
MWFKPEIKLICIDLDNTLCDYGSAESETEAYMAEKISKKYKLKTFDILKAFNEVKHSHMHHDFDPKMFSRELWFRETLEKIGKKLTVLGTKKLEEEYWEYLVPKIRIFPNTLYVLTELKKRYKLASITDSDGEKHIKIDRIKALGLDKYFDYIITTDDTGKNKPAIENWELLLKLSELKAKQCMMVGDHPDVDLINAKKLGFSTIWTKEHINTDSHFRYVDHEIRDIIELIDVVKKYD